MEIQKLSEIVSIIDVLISKLMEISLIKQKVLIQRDHDQLRALTEQEQKYLNQIFHLTKQQKLHADKLKMQFNLPAEITSLSEIMKLIGGNIDRALVKKILASLKSIKSNSDQLQKINEQNKMLIETSRVFIKGIIQAVRGSDNSAVINRQM